MLRRSSTEVTGGILGQYGLIDWWHATFSDQVRRYIDEVYKKSFKTYVGLTQGARLQTKDNAATFLNKLAGRLMKSHKDRRYAYLMLKKAETLCERSEDVVTLHKIHTAMIRLHAEDLHRDPGAQTFLESACEKHIAAGEAIAKHFRNLQPDEPLPRHAGFETLAVIREKQEKYDEAIELCKQALAQGWSGCYDRHMERCAQRKAGGGAVPETVVETDESPPEEEAGLLCFECALRLAESHASIAEGCPEIPKLVAGVCPACHSAHSLDASDLDG